MPTAPPAKQVAPFIRFITLFLGIWAGAALISAKSSLAEPADAAAPRDAREVVVGAYINDIQELDFRTQSYSVDVYVWFRWRDKNIDPSKSLEFMNRFAPNAHVRDQIYDSPKALPDGTFYAVVRNQGRFSTKLAVGNYPFDKQELRIELEDFGAGFGVSHLRSGHERDHTFSGNLSSRVQDRPATAPN